MNKQLCLSAVAAIAAVAFLSADSFAQNAAPAATTVAPGTPHCPAGIGLGTCGVGEITAQCVCTKSGYPRPINQLRYAARDKISPSPFYSYSHRGITAQHTHQWNQQQMNNYPWHCNNSYWQYGRPTALVVPPNSAFQSIYSWGVAETRSVPIYHQFGRAYPGTAGTPGVGGFPAAPYWPSNTSQFGVYPVRAPF